MFSHSSIIKISIFVFGVIAFFVPQETQALIFQLDNSSSYQPSASPYGTAMVWTNTSTWSGSDPDATHDKIILVRGIVSANGGIDGCNVEASLRTIGGSVIDSNNEVTLTEAGEWYDVVFSFTAGSSAYEDEITTLSIQAGDTSDPCSSLSNYSLAYKTSVDADGYLYAQTCNGNVASVSCSVLAPGDMFFVVETTADTINARVDNVSMTETMPSLVCGDFVSWNVDTSFSASSSAAIIAGTEYSVCVSYAEDSADLGTASSTWDCVGVTGVLNRYVQVPKLESFDGSIDYWAKAYMYDSFVVTGVGETAIDESNLELVSFSPLEECQNVLNVTPSSLEDLQNLIPDPTSICSEDDDVIRTILCDLFVPAPDTWRSFGSLYKKIQNKPPFGYLTIYTGAIDDLASATSTTSSVQTVDSSLSSALALYGEIDILETLRTFLSWFLWIVFVFYIYHRFKNFSLHG